LTEFVPGRSSHTYTLVEELGPLAFLRGRVEAFRTPVEGRNWTREAVKRFVIPPLALIHTLLGLAVLAAWGTMSGRENDPVALVCIMLGSLHFAVVSMAEQTGVALPWAAAAVGLALAELAAAIAVMTLGSRRAPRRPRPMSARMSVVHAEDAEDALRPVALGAVDGTAQQVVKKMA
jgi:lipopolysaccharide export system permease protein